MSDQGDRTEPEHDEILHSLLTERTVDIVTTGRRTGQARTTEIWTTCLFGEVYLCGTPNAGKAGVERQPRDWVANLLAEPRFTVLLKRGATAVLAARAERVTDPDQRRRILTQPATEYYRDAVGLEAALAHSPILRVTFEGDAVWLNDAVAQA